MGGFERQRHNILRNCRGKAQFTTKTGDKQLRPQSRGNSVVGCVLKALMIPKLDSGTIYITEHGGYVFDTHWFLENCIIQRNHGYFGGAAEMHSSGVTIF
ncbi:hypothetical protein ILYODFUR_009265 [Ilyodon furcidens]|uniref:Uncharacterized protein n=1 Tax=Ilyodon furcidens TaxID=33524 RepID=A0ABV0TUX3_9TELE